MEQLVDRVAGLDVHRDTVVATVRRPRPGGGRAAKTLTFATTVAELTALGDWLVAEGVELAGMSDPVELAELARGRLRAKIPALQKALRGCFRVEHHGILVAQMLAHVDFLDESIAELDARIETAVADYQPVLQRVMTIPGV